jgi:hypothetical protein
MKIEYVEITLKTVLEYFQKDFKSKTGAIKNFGDPIVDAAKGLVVFKLYLDNHENWNRRYHHHKFDKKKGDK